MDVQGNLYTPRTGVGTLHRRRRGCSDSSGHATVSGSTVQLPTAVSYPTPQIPAPSPVAAQSFSTVDGTTCAALGLTGANCSVSGSTITVNGHGTTLSLPSVSLASHINIVLVASSPPAQYNFNSISLNGGSTVSISATGATQAVLVDVVGLNPDLTPIATPIDMVGGTFAAVNGCVTCSNFDASMLQFIYGGTGTVNMTGNSGAAATFYAPNATVNFQGTADLYGSMLGKRIDNVGNGNIHYDRRLQHDFYVAGHPMSGTFTWKRY